MSGHAVMSPARARDDFDAQPWAGETRRYDIVKEFAIATLAVGVLVLALAAIFSSPDDKALSFSGWAKAAPADFVTTAISELDGTSGTATYGAPYTHEPGAGAKLGPLPLQRWAGVRSPVDTAKDLVLAPLATIPGDAALTSALATYSGATADQQKGWTTAYGDAVTKADSPANLTDASFGPLPVMMNSLLGLATNGGLEGAIAHANGAMYQTNYTKPLLFMADGTYLEDAARAQHLGGDQWGMMNETGNYPGQAWLWLYTFWYQIKPFSTSPNADALVLGLMMVLSLGLLLVPWIPGLRSLPAKLGVHRLIWRDYYRSHPRSG